METLPLVRRRNLYHPLTADNAPTCAVFHRSGVSLSACTNLRKLQIDLRQWDQYHDGFHVCATLLTTVSPAAALEVLILSVECVEPRTLGLPQVVRAFAELESSIAALPKLRHLQWELAFRETRNSAPFNPTSIISLLEKRSTSTCHVQVNTSRITPH